MRAIGAVPRAATGAFSAVAFILPTGCVLVLHHRVLLLKKNRRRKDPLRGPTPMGTGYLFLLLENRITKKDPGKGSINGLYLGVKWAKRRPYQEAADGGRC